MILVNVHEAKSQLSALLAAVEKGEEVVIACNGTPVVELVLYKQHKDILGSAEGIVTYMSEDFDAPLDIFVTSLNASIGVKTLPISVADACAVHTLPWHHRDPIDRMLVAQASANNLVFVSKDTELKSYGVKVLW